MVGPASRIELAEKLCRITQYKQPLALDALATAYAETGKFDAVYFERITGISVSETKLAEINQVIEGDAKYLTSVIADVLEEELRSLIGVGWTSHNHTSEHVELAALGPGSEAFPMFVNNNEVHGLMRNALRI